MRSADYGFNASPSIQWGLWPALGESNLRERFTSIVLITLWVVGTAWFPAEIFKVCKAGAVFIPYVVVTVVVMLALVWMLVRAGVRHPH